MSPRHHPVRREIRLNPPHRFVNRRRCIPPIAHQVAEDNERSHEVHAGGLHAGVGGVAVEGCGGGAGFDVGEDGEAGGC